MTENVQKKTITRVDLTAEAGWVKVQKWTEGWKEGDKPIEQTTIKGNPFFLLTD